MGNEDDTASLQAQRPEGIGYLHDHRPKFCGFCGYQLPDSGKEHIIGLHTLCWIKSKEREGVLKRPRYGARYGRRK
jgi:hypothetical protein